MTTAYILIGLAVLVVLLRWGFKIGSSSPVYQPQAQQNDPPSPTAAAPPAASGSGTATAPSPPPTPTPPPAAFKSRGWVWSFAFVFFGGLIALTIYHKVLVPSFNFPGPPSQATAPKPQTSPPYRTSAKLMEDKSVGVEVEKRDAAGKYAEVKIPDGGKALFFAEIPQEFSGTVYFKGYITRFHDGELKLRVNGTEFQNLHKGGGRFWKVFSFPASILHSGTNTFVLSSPGEYILVERMEIEVN